MNGQKPCFCEDVDGLRPATRTILFVTPPVSFFVVLFLFVLVFLFELFSLFCFVLRTLAIRPGSPSVSHLHGGGTKSGQKFHYGVKPDIYKYAAMTHEPAPLAADVPGHSVVGRAPASPALTKPVLSWFRRPRLPLVPVVSARKFLPAQVAISLPGDFFQPEEDALSTLSWSHVTSIAASVWNVWHIFCDS